MAPPELASLPPPLLTAVILCAFFLIPSSFLGGCIVFLLAPAASWLAARLLWSTLFDVAAAAPLLAPASFADADDVAIEELPGKFEVSPSELLKRDTMGTRPFALGRLLMKLNDFKSVTKRENSCIKITTVLSSYRFLAGIEACG